MNELERLRKEVERKRKAASNKIARTRRQNGAELAGSQFDPRRNPGVEQRYNRAQLNSYLSQLNDFMRRTNQFVGAKSGIPMRKGRFDAYKKLETQQDQLRRAHDAAMGDIPTPTGMSIAGNKQMLHQGAGNAVYGPYREFDRMPSDITGPAALEKLIKDMRTRVSSEFLPNRIQQGKENLKKALTVIGRTEFIEDIDKLNDYQFDAFWYGTNVAEAVFMQYGIETDRVASEVEGEEPTRKERAQDKVIQGAVDELGSVLQWASGLRGPGEATEKIRGFKR